MPNTAALIASLPGFLDNIRFEQVGLIDGTEDPLDGLWQVSLDPITFAVKAAAVLIGNTPLDSSGQPVPVLGVAIYDRYQSVLFYLDVFGPSYALPLPSYMAVLDWPLSSLIPITGVPKTP